MGKVQVRYYGRHVIWGPFEEIADDDLDRVQHEIGSALPQQYREFVLVAHGGTLPYAVRLPPGDPDGRLSEFADLYSIRGDSWGSVIGESRLLPSAYMAKHLPPNLLAVARDGGGSQLYLDLRAGTFGHVWAFVHGLPTWAGGDSTDRGGVVATDWNGYLDLLTIDEDYAQEVWDDAQSDPDDSWTAAVVAWLDSGLPDWRATSWAAR